MLQAAKVKTKARPYDVYRVAIQTASLETANKWEILLVQFNLSRHNS